MLSTPDLIAVGVQGDDVRRRMHGTRTTFCRVFEVHVGAPPATLPAGVNAGEFRIVGKPATIEAALQAVAATSALAGGAIVTGFSLTDLWALAPGSEGLGALCARLKESGLEAVAEMPIDADLLPDVGVGGEGRPRLRARCLAIDGSGSAAGRSGRDRRQVRARRAGEAAPGRAWRLPCLRAALAGDVGADADDRLR